MNVDLKEMQRLVDDYDPSLVENELNIYMSPERVQALIQRMNEAEEVIELASDPHLQEGMLVYKADEYENRWK